jgi:hypothetical protein
MVENYDERQSAVKRLYPPSKKKMKNYLYKRHFYEEEELSQMSKQSTSLTSQGDAVLSSDSDRGRRKRKSRKREKFLYKVRPKFKEDEDMELIGLNPKF